MGTSLLLVFSQFFFSLSYMSVTPMKLVLACVGGDSHCGFIVPEDKIMILLFWWVFL